LDHCILLLEQGNLIQFFDAVDRILRQQKEAQEEARAAAESKVKENRNIVHPLHPLGAGIKQLPVAGSHGISPQHEVSQATDKLVDYQQPPTEPYVQLSLHTALPVRYEFL
jgi:hypothetical protein